MIFALAHSGVCAAFSRETNERLCYLNVKDDEVVRSLFYNKNNETLITVSVYATDNFSSLKCRSTPLEFIRRGKPEEGGMAIFEEESLQVSPPARSPFVTSRVQSRPIQTRPARKREAAAALDGISNVK